MPFVCMHVKQPIFPRRNSWHVCTKILHRSIRQSLLHIEWCRHAAQAEIFPLSRLTTEQKSCPSTPLLIFFSSLFNFMPLPLIQHMPIFSVCRALWKLLTLLYFSALLSHALDDGLFFQCLQVYLKPVSPDFMFFCFVFSPLTSETVCRFQI